MGTTKQRRMRGPTSFTRTALRRCIQAAADVGIPHRIEVDPTTGKITMIPGEAADSTTEPSDWDKALAGSHK